MAAECQCCPPVRVWSMKTLARLTGHDCIPICNIALALALLGRPLLSQHGLRTRNRRNSPRASIEHLGCRGFLPFLIIHDMDQRFPYPLIVDLDHEIGKNLC